MKPYDAIRTRLARSPEAGAAAGFSVIFLVFALATPDTFLSHSAISSILNSQAVPGILAIGITLLMISGEFDLSVGSILGVSSLAFLYATVKGIGVIFITHNISHVFEVADRATILSHGEKVGDFPICDVTQDDIASMVMGQGIPEHLLISCPNHSKRQ